MNAITFTTRDGTPWTPRYLESIDAESCIGCGRCYKVCPQDVLALMGVNEDGDLVDPFDDDEEIERKVMTVANPGACIGCAACERICGSRCQMHMAA
ncbi:ferredoxin III, nif-specific [Roseospirillum parvum]|uniref:Ferredoxin III n=1 Tax=Roseospirillum parvum TaxID=83401 RepID=A0A1G8GAA3_9PROT|nr:ferredoxin III, nif-specific [Roseospirillum parvum]SDH91293.1 ferredoxin III, nif-specific [Roseospirillum parvum]